MSETTDFYLSWLGPPAFGTTSSPPTPANPFTVFTPLDISGCSIWFNCDDQETIVQDVVGNLSTIRNLGAVSGEAATTLGSVTVVQDINNLNCLAFASTSLLSFTATLPYTSRTTFLVYKVTSDLSANTFVGYPYVDFFAGELNYELISIGYNVSNSNYEYIQGINGIDTTLLGTTSENPYNVPQFLTLLTDFATPANNLLKINNGSNLNIATPSNVFSTSSALYTFNTSNGLATHTLGEMIEYDRTLDANELFLVDNYLQAKWFIPTP